MVRDSILSVVKATDNLEDKSKKKESRKSKKELAAELAEIRQKLKELRDLAGRYIDDMDSVKQDEARLRTIFESIRSGILLVDAERHVIVDVNTVAAKMIGLSRREIVGTICHKHVCPAEAGGCPITDLGQTVDNSERVLLGYDGRIIPIIKTVNTIFINGRRHLIESFVDNTERKRAEEEIKKYRDNLEQLVEKRTADLEKVMEQLHAEIAERRQAENSLKRNETLLRLILNLSTNFICLPAEETDNGIDDVLKVIGQFADVDRSYVFQFSENGTRVDNTHEWCAPGILAQKEELRGVTANDLPWFFKSIKRLETIHIPDVAQLPAGAEAEKEEFMREGIQSLIVVPVVSNNLLIGFLGLDSVRSKKNWPEGIISLLKIVGEIVANALAQKKAAEAMKRGSAKYQALFENASDAIFLIKGGVFIDCNPKSLEMFRSTKQRILGKTPYSFCPEFQPDGSRSQDVALEKGRSVVSGTPQYFEFRHRRGDGTLFDAEVSLSRVDIANEVLLQAIIRDVTARKNWEHALQESEARYRSLFGESQDAIYIATQYGAFIDVNRSFLDLFGYTRDEILKLNAKIAYVNEKDIENFKKIIKKDGYVKAFEQKLKKKNGTIMDCILTVTTKKDAGGRIVAYQGIIRDITAEKLAEQTIRHMAYHDALTGLPNRTLFNDRLNMAILNAQRNHKRAAVMMLDLDKFKQINDVWGHKFGDLLLKTVGERLIITLRKSDTVARMGGDEFLVIIPEVDHVDDTDIIAGKILQAFSETFVISDRNLSVTTSVGIAVYPQDGKDAETLIKHADIAMYAAKTTGRNQYMRYSSQM
ncbi:MAG: Cyclic di-GMP phosphodiesterase Gmr [Syntrophorhabdus sp. PtaU1.Bin058]|nr:MAG: Cyclic di-GMP phosphodiesterase Gmr [Syntrophorhabdus sp. PtaU1.Bin058]